MFLKFAVSRGIHPETLPRLLETHGAPIKNIELGDLEAFDLETFDVPEACYYLPAYGVALSLTVDLPQFTSRTIYSRD